MKILVTLTMLMTAVFLVNIPIQHAHGNDTSALGFAIAALLGGTGLLFYSISTILANLRS